MNELFSCSCKRDIKYYNEYVYAFVTSQRLVLVWVLDCAVFHLIMDTLGSIFTPSLLDLLHTWMVDCGT